MKKCLHRVLSVLCLLSLAAINVQADDKCYGGCKPNTSNGTIECIFSCCDTGYSLESIAGFLKLACHGNEIVAKCEITASGSTSC